MTETTAETPVGDGPPPPKAVVRTPSRGFRLNLYRPHPQTRVVVVASGVDTLHLWTRAPVRQERVEELTRLRAMADATDSREVVTLDGAELVVQPHRLRKGSVLLESDFYAVKVAPQATGNDATVTVELRSLELWSRGWRHAADRAERIMRELVQAGAELETQVGRCDVTIDLQGWAPTPHDRARFRCQSPNRARYYARRERPAWEDRRVLAKEVQRCALVVAELGAELEKGEPDLAELVAGLHRLHQVDADLFAEFDQAGELTGYTFGRGGVVSSRLYDKTREVRKTRKGHMRAVWRRCPDFRENQPVWRLEFQLMREGLRTLEVDTPGGWVDLGEWHSLRTRVDAVWGYCTGRWLWHGTRTNTERRNFSHAWRTLHEQTIDHGYQIPLQPVTWRTDLRRIVLEGAVQPVHAGLAGYLSSAVAHELERHAAARAAGEARAVIDVHEAARRAVELAVRDAERRGKPVAERAHEKFEALEVKREHLAGRKLRHAAAFETLRRMPGEDG